MKIEPTKTPICNLATKDVGTYNFEAYPFDFSELQCTRERESRSQRRGEESKGAIK